MMTAKERESFIRLINFANSMGSDIADNVLHQRDISEILWKINMWEKTIKQTKELGENLSEYE